MKKWGQPNIAYIIMAVIGIIISLQLYWNFKNYKTTKESLTNEVLSSLNTSIDSYYTDLAKKNIKTISNNIIAPTDNSIGKIEITKKIKSMSSVIRIDTVFTIYKDDKIPEEIKKMILKKKNHILDSLTSTALANKVIVSLSNDNVDLKLLSGYVNEELKQKGFTFPYALTHIKNNTIINTFNNPENNKFEIVVKSKSSYLPTGSDINISFPNINLLALKKNFIGIIISFFLASGIIFSLIYLVRTINQQKQLALSKSDFISNITHELKTPIATSLSALEGIQYFNASNDKDKTERYLNIQSQQLQKLNSMVEKILETASLESEQLELTKEHHNIIPLLENVSDKLGVTTKKEILLEVNNNHIICSIDIFHFENVISNLVENAIKYGGDKVTVSAIYGERQAEILVKDNGTPIDKIYKEKIFDKFYRIPNNNRHDVKGYGIGLYYSKKIIEKHGGTLNIVHDNHFTIFKITVPYA